MAQSRCDPRRHISTTLALLLLICGCACCTGAVCPRSPNRCQEFRDYFDGTNFQEIRPLLCSTEEGSTSCALPDICRIDCTSYFSHLSMCLSGGGPTRRRRSNFDSCGVCPSPTSVDPCGLAIAPYLSQQTVTRLSEMLDCPLYTVSRCNDCDHICANLSSLRSTCADPSDVIDDELLRYCFRQANITNDFICNITQITGVDFNCQSMANIPMCVRLCVENNLEDLPFSCREEVREECISFLDYTSKQLSMVPNEMLEGVVSAQLVKYVQDLEIDNISDVINVIISSAEQRQGHLERTTVAGIVDAFEEIFDEDFAPTWMRRLEQNSREIFEGLDKTVLQIIEELLNNEEATPFLFTGNNTVFNVGKREAFEDDSDFEFPTDDIEQNSKIARKASIRMPYQAFCENQDDCSPVLGVSVADNLAEYILEDIESEDSETRVASVLLSAYIFNSSFDIDERLKLYPVEVYFKPQIPGNIDIRRLKCNFLNATTFNWSTEGVSTEYMDNGDIRCITTHLTSFAILLSTTGDTSTSPEEAFSLSVVSYVGCAISIVSLCLTILVLVVLRKKLRKGSLLYIHLNLSIALLLALIVFVAGLETATHIPTLCTVIAAVIQYLFLCVFCWMLSEGIMLYFLVVKVFSNLAKRWYLLLFLGWGVPIPIVAISAGLLHEDYGTSRYCWIEADPSRPAIWTFVGPVILILVINSVILVVTIVAILRGRKKGGAEQEVKNVELARTAVKGSVVLLPLLGMTWILGVFAVDANTTVFAWLFTILNSLQGLFIFLLHVVRNEVVLKKLKKCWVSACPRCRPFLYRDSSPSTKSESLLRNKSTSILVPDSTCTANLREKEEDTNSLCLETEMFSKDGANIIAKH